jgi:predicted ATP-grasp superfamily ATP-dependent carboligase
VATGDPWVRFIVRHRARLDAAFGAVLHPSNEALEICLDKQRFAAWCGAHGFDTPRSWWPGAGARPEGLGFPVLVRPAQTLHGLAHAGLPKAVEIHDESALAALLAKFDAAGCAAVVSESLLGPGVTQYSVPFARRSDALLSFVARKVRPAPERCSVGTFVELSPQPEIEAVARRAVQELDYFGVGEVEILHVAASGRASLIEINARPWLQYALAPASGHDFLDTLLRRPVQGGLRRTRGRTWIDLRSDLFGALSSSVGAVRRGRLGLGAYLASLTRANVHARFDWRDPLPALYRDGSTRAAPGSAAGTPGQGGSLGAR